MGTVLFLGAGFSASFGLPTMRQFFGHVNTSKVVSSPDKDLMRELRQRARAASSMLDGQHDNLEHILSLSLMDDSALTDSQESRSIPTHTRVCRVLQQVYSDLKPAAFEGIRNTLRNMLGWERGEDRHEDLTIVTTNYDVVAEFGLALNHRAPRLPFLWEEVRGTSGISGQLYSHDESQPLICKLHGSINWSVPDPTGEVIRVVSGIESGVTFPGLEGGGPKNVLVPLIHGMIGKAMDNSQPLLVPPTLYKQQTESVLLRSWRAAHAALRAARRVAIIGYSFPHSDTYMRYFLASALVANTDLERIDVVNPEASAIIDRLKQLDYGSHFKQMLVAIDKPAHQYRISGS